MHVTNQAAPIGYACCALCYIIILNVKHPGIDIPGVAGNSTGSTSVPITPKPQIPWPTYRPKVLDPLYKIPRWWTGGRIWATYQLRIDSFWTKHAYCLNDHWFTRAATSSDNR